MAALLNPGGTVEGVVMRAAAPIQSARERFAIALQPAPVAMGVAGVSLLGGTAVLLDWLPLWVVTFHIVSLFLWEALLIWTGAGPKNGGRRRLVTWLFPTVMLAFVMTWHAFQPGDYQLWLTSTLVFAEVAQWLYREGIAT